MNQDEREEEAEVDDIDCEYTRNIVCPHCGHEERDSADRLSDDGKDTCDDCRKPFSWHRNIEITYFTEKPNE